MAMAIDSRQQLGGLPYEQTTMRYPAPQFTDPWASVAGAQSQTYATAVPHHQQQQQQHQVPAAMSAGDHSRPALATSQATAVSMPQYAQTHHALPALAMPSGITQSTTDPLLLLPQQNDLQYQAYAPRPYGSDYPVSAGPASAGGYSAAPTSAPQAYSAASTLSPYGAATFQDRRPSHPSVASASPSIYGDQLEALKHRQAAQMVDYESRLSAASEAERNSFSDALDASKGLAAMSQDITPRNIYGTQGSSRSSIDSYGFPSAHSSHSSVSSASNYGSYWGGSSVSEASVGDYSSASESVDMPSRTLPRPTGLLGATMPPAPQTMMGQFSSKVASSSQKKHKCKVCDKRFTRPSSLQTHMYSHTGEKPFACDVEGCGRHFSVVSNLRRHKKVHKGESDYSGDDE